jgi:hypothetical protein
MDQSDYLRGMITCKYMYAKFKTANAWCRNFPNDTPFS